MAKECRLRATVTPPVVQSGIALGAGQGNHLVRPGLQSISRHRLCQRLWGSGARRIFVSVKSGKEEKSID